MARVRAVTSSSDPGGTSHTINARAALVGNPSDGYGGAVLSMPVPAYAATVTVRETSADTAALARNLLDATQARFSADVAPVQHVHLHANTTIPRSVGLAGSSAIVIAALRALAQHCGTEVNNREVAELAHTIERVDLDIPGGRQDQMIQADTSGRPLLMEFAEPMHYRALAPRPTDVFVLWSASGEQPSSVPHRDLRSRAHELETVWAELAALARQAAVALEAGDHDALGSAIDDTFHLRESIMAIEPMHRHMIDVARGAGAPCNFAGSGGAISGLVPPDRERFTQVVELAGLTVQTWRLEVPSQA